MEPTDKNSTEIEDSKNESIKDLNIDTHDEVVTTDSSPLILEEITDEVALNTITQSLTVFRTVDWSRIFPQKIHQLKSEELVGSPIKVLARVASITDQYPLQIGERRYTVLDVILKDKSDEEIECLTIEYSSFGNELSELFQHSKLAVFSGSVISIIEEKKKKYKFLIHNVDSRINAEQLIYVRNQDQINVERNNQLQLLINQNQVFSFIKNTIVREMGIRGLESASQLNQAIDFMIYQAFSFGKNQNASMRLHSLVVGAPGSGKKLLTNIATTLNPVAEEVSAADGKVTLAGMIGNVAVKDNRKISQPGYLSLASGGVLCIQDFHEIRRNRNAVLESFAKVMEDGEVIDSTSARTIHTAETSIHLDTNKYSQVYEANSESSLKDIEIPTNVITRFDFIIDIPADANRQWNVMLSMSGAEKTLSSFASRVEENEELRWLKRLMAHLISYTPEVTISREVADYKVQKLEELRKEYSPKITNLNAWQGIFTRIGISIDKYIKAITTSRFTNISTTADVDLAISFIRPKLDFICTLKDSRVSSIENVNERLNLILSNFKGQEVHKNSVLEFLKSRSIDVNIKTVERDLAELEEKGKVKKGKRAHWEILE